jgi:magnesium-protoporphyrin IX monomethyl ester (oxidative) cyclase
MFKRVLLVNPNYKEKACAPLIFAGLGYIAESLKQNKIAYDFIDLNLGYPESVLFDKINSFKPDLIGVQIMSIKYLQTYEFLGKIKEKFPDIKIVAGGAHITTFRENALEECIHIDYGVIFEGEKTIVELCKKNDLENVKNLLIRKRGKIIYTGPRELEKNPDIISWPSYEKFELSKYPELLIPIVSSRGCPYRCKFCTIATCMGNHFRVRSAKNVAEELEYWYKKGVRKFNFADDNFTFYKKRVEELCDEIKKRKLEGIRIQCSNGVRADRVDHDLLKKMKETGFNQLFFGVESANNHVLKNMNKTETIETIEKAVKIACDLGYETGLFFIIGYPGETFEDFKNSVKFALKYPISYVFFYNIIPFPNTPLYDYLKENNLLLCDYKEYINNTSHYQNNSCFYTPEMSTKEREKAFLLGKQTTNEVIRRRIVRQYKNLGPIAKIGARIFINEKIKNLFLYNPFFKRILDRLK